MESINSTLCRRYQGNTEQAWSSDEHETTATSAGEMGTRSHCHITSVRAI